MRPVSCRGTQEPGISSDMPFSHGSVLNHSQNIRDLTLLPNRSTAADSHLDRDAQASRGYCMTLGPASAIRGDGYCSMHPLCPHPMVWYLCAIACVTLRQSLCSTALSAPSSSSAPRLTRRPRSRKSLSVLHMYKTQEHSSANISTCSAETAEMLSMRG